MTVQNHASYIKNTCSSVANVRDCGLDHLTKMSWAGTVKVRIIQAAKIPSADVNGQSDPYCSVTLGRVTKRTKAIERTLNPVWNEGFCRSYHCLCLLVITSYRYSGIRS